MSSVYSYRHHIIPFHEWKRRIDPKATRSDKDFNAPDNLVWLTFEQHIQVHQLLYELNGSRFDLLAAKMLLGSIGREEGIEEARRLSVTGIPKSLQHRQKLKEARSHRIISPETRRKLILTQTGRKRGPYKKFIPRIT